MSGWTEESMKWERVGGKMVCILQITIAGDRNASDVKPYRGTVRTRW